MTEQKTLIQLSLYLLGDNLNPQYVTLQLGINPTDSQYKGEKKVTSTNHEVVTKTGMWMLRADTNSQVLSNHIEELASKIPVSGDSLRSIEGVEDVHLDIFIAVTSNDPCGNSSEFWLNKESVASLGKIDLPICFTVAHIYED